RPRRRRRERRAARDQRRVARRRAARGRRLGADPRGVRALEDRRSRGATRARHAAADGLGPRRRARRALRVRTAMKEDEMTGERKSQQRGRPVFAPTKGAYLVGESVNTQGNEVALNKMEKGRVFVEEQGSDRPAGRASARMASGVNPLESVTGTFL